MSTSFAPPPYQGQRPMRILSLDGGGIRGLASLCVLQRLMLELQVTEDLDAPPLPCDWFDLIVGTSTGGLIALMLGRLKMSVMDAIKAYRTLSEKVFGEDTRNWLELRNPLETTSKYSAEKLEQAVKEIAAEGLLADPDKEPKCRVAVVAVMQRGVNRLPALLRTYRTTVPPDPCTIVEAARATSAATTFFPPARFDSMLGVPVTYLDGGLGHNNPTRLAVHEAVAIWPDRMIGAIVSVGTGISSLVNFEGNSLALAKKLLDITTDCQAVHQDMEQRFGGMPKKMYFRFDPPQDLAEIGLDEWRKLDDVGDLAAVYINGAQVKLKECIAAITHPAVNDVLALRTAVKMAIQQDVKHMPKPIPPFPVPFVGRDSEVADIVQKLCIPGVGIAILGSGGIGKTEVATAVLHHHDVQEAYGAFRFFIRCDSATVSSRGATESGLSVENAAGQLVSLIAANLGLDESGGHTDDMGMPRCRTDERLLYFFSRQHAVLVLDNFETLWDRSGPDLDELIKRLRALPNLRLIVTMRGNVTPGIDWHAKQLDTLDMESVRKIFINYSGQPHFVSDPVLDKLLAAVDRLPLAIVLLAKQARTKSNLQSLWEDRERQRTAMVRDARYQNGAAGARLLSLEASIQLSLDRPMMTSMPPALTLLSLLSLLPDGASWGDLEALVPSSSLPRECGRPEDVLLQLSLAYAVTSASGQPSTRDVSCANFSRERRDRLLVLAPIREYVQYKYPPGEADYDRLRKHYLLIAASLDANNLLRSLRPEIHNVEAVTVRALNDQSEQERAVKSSVALCAFSNISGMALPALAQSLREVLPILSDRKLAAVVLVTLGRMAFCHFDYGEAKARFEEARVIYVELKDSFGRVLCIESLGQVARFQSKYDEARERFEEALVLYVELNDSSGRAHCVQSLGQVDRDQSKYDEARERFEEALVLYVELNDSSGRAHCVQSLGQVDRDQSKYDEARERFAEARALYDELNDSSGRAHCVQSLGQVDCDQSKYDEARERFAEARTLYDELDDRLGSARCIHRLGQVDRFQSKYDEARERFGEALVLYVELNDSLGRAQCIHSLGQVDRFQSKYDEARQRFEEALVLYVELKDSFGRALCIQSLGQVARDQLKYDEATEKFAEALSLFDELDDRRGRAQCIRSLGQVDRDQSKYDEATERFAEALALFDELDDRRGRAQCFQHLGEVARQRSNYNEAIERFQEALVLFDGLDDSWGKAKCSHGLGLIARHQSQYNETRERFEAELVL